MVMLGHESGDLHSHLRIPGKAQEQNHLHKVALTVHVLCTHTLAHMHTHIIYNVHNNNKAGDIQMYIIVEGAKGKNDLLKRSLIRDLKFIFWAAPVSVCEPQYHRCSASTLTTEWHFQPFWFWIVPHVA